MSKQLTREEKKNLLSEGFRRYGIRETTVADNVGNDRIDTDEINNYIDMCKTIKSLFKMSDEEVGLNGDLCVVFDKKIEAKQFNEAVLDGLLENGLTLKYNPYSSAFIHEWAHAWDIHTYNVKNGLPPRELNQVGGLLKGKHLGSESWSIRFPESYKQRCAQADHELKEQGKIEDSYYTKPAEMFARAVEVFASNIIYKPNEHNYALCLDPDSYKNNIIYPDINEAMPVVRQMMDRYRDFQQQYLQTKSENNLANAEFKQNQTVEPASKKLSQAGQKEPITFSEEKPRKILSFEERFGSDVLDDVVADADETASEHNSSLPDTEELTPKKDSPEL